MFFFNSQIIVSNSMRTFTYQGLPQFGTNILVGKKKKKTFWCLVTINSVQALWFTFI